MAKELIYIVEDDIQIQQFLKYNIELSGYLTAVFDDGETALDSMKNRLPDLLLLDIILPGKDGMEICRILKTEHRTNSIPIIILTAKSDEFDKVLGLEMGVDDYLTKPFSIRELLARMRAIIRRVPKENREEPSQEHINIGDLVINSTRHEVYKGYKFIKLALKEFFLLRLLVLNKGKVLSREVLLDKVWGLDYFAGTRTVDVHIHCLRQKLGDNVNGVNYIETVRGIGYRFSDRI